VKTASHNHMAHVSADLS